MTKLTPSQFKALLYGDVFEFPLKKDGLDKFQIASQIKTEAKKTKSGAGLMEADVKRIEADSGYFFLRGREKLVEIRKKREKYSQEKVRIAKRVGKWLQLIPTIKMIAITGAVAVDNAKKDDDIDLMIVTSKNRVWTTRFLSILLVELLGKRRRPNDKNFKNKICLNMFLDEDNLSVPKKERDLFSAHEAAQVKIIFSKNGIEKRWWKENGWIRNYLPKFKDSKIQRFKTNPNFKFQSFKNFLILKLIYHLSFIIYNFGEELLKQTQLAYMNSKRTEEVVRDGYLRFHPKDARKWIMQKYQKRLREYGVE